MAPTNKRSAAIILHLEGKSQAQIRNILNMPKSTVQSIISRYQELGTILDRPRTGRPKTSKSTFVVNKVRKRITRNPNQSLRKMAKSLNINRESIRLIVKDKLGRYPYKLSKAHMLTEDMKENRLQKARKMKRYAAAGREKSILFTDEKIFTVQRFHNQQNERQWLFKSPTSRKNGSVVLRRHFPKSVMVWAGICATGKTPLVFIDPGTKVNAKMYQDKILREVLLPWSQQHFGQASWTLQQDWAPAHSAKSTIEFCKSLFSNILSG